MSRRMLPAVRRFWMHVDKTEGCWLWKSIRTGNVCYDKYGKFEANHVIYDAHRYSWRMHYGEIPDGMCVLHECDVRPCVRPDHLFLGTKRDNNLDCKAKGRNARGEKNGCAKLTEEQVTWVREVHSKGMMQKDIAVILGIHVNSVGRIIHRELWGHC